MIEQQQFLETVKMVNGVFVHTRIQSSENEANHEGRFFIHQSGILFFRK